MILSSAPTSDRAFDKKNKFKMNEELLISSLLSNLADALTDCFTDGRWSLLCTSWRCRLD
jgi:hypothetical protein